jgi:uncharacterized protein (TIGR02118 family)
MSVIVLRTEYPHVENGRFDEAYYLDHHLPLAIEILGDYVQDYRTYREVRFGGKAPKYILVTEIDFATREDFEKAMTTPRMAELKADGPNYTDLKTVVTNYEDGREHR